jgi:hypothetical protein
MTLTAPRPQQIKLDDLLAEVRRQIEPTEVPLREARLRLQLVRAAAETFPGALRTYPSGSLAVHTMNKPVTDGDGGVVLDRRQYPELGPDGGGKSPDEVVDLLCAHIGPIVRRAYPNAVVQKSKRGPEVHFHAPVEGQDPTVDLVLALNRKVGNGIWIPNLTKHSWDASDPEKHVELLNSGSESFRSVRRKVIRLAKAWNKQFPEPGVCSFELSVWAYEFLEPGIGVASGLYELFDSAAARLEAHEPTHDPAGVSDDLRLLLDASVVASRLRKAANATRAALDAVTDADARIALSRVFWDYLPNADGGTLASSARQLATGAAIAATSLGVSVAGATTAAARSYGGEA